MKTLILLLFVFAATALWVPAQDSTPASPKEPILRRAPDFASWTITFSSAQAPVTPGQPAPHFFIDRPQSITVQKTGRIYQEVTVFQSGRKSERWIHDGVELDQLPGSDQISMVRHNEVVVADVFDYSKADFRGLDWLSPKNFKDVESFGGKPAFSFETKVPVGNGKSFDKKSAMLDAKTQLPLVSRDSNWVLTYAYNPPPSASLVPPENFLKVFKDMGVEFK